MRPIFALSLAAALLCAASAQAQQRGRTLRTHEGPQSVDEADLVTARERLAASTLRGRVEIPLSGTADRQVIEGEGAVVLVQIDGQPVLITPFAWVAGASLLQIEIDGAWVDARVIHGSNWYDLAAVEIDATLPDTLVALELATEFPLDPLLFVATPAGSADAEIAVTGFGITPGGSESWYVRALTPLRNGFAIIDRNGRLIAITSIAARDRHDGTYALSFERIRLWLAAWDSIDRGEPWDYRVIEEATRPTTGIDALR